MRARNILCILLIVGVFAAQAYAAGPYPDWISPSPTSENLVPIDNIEPVPNTGGEIGSSQTVNGFTQYSVDLGDATYFISDIQAGGLLQQGTADPSKPWDRFGTVVFEASTVGTVTRAPGYYPDTSNAFIKPNFPGVSALNLNQFAYLPTKNAVLVVDTKMKRTVGEIVTGTENTNIALDPRNLRSLIVSRPSNEVLVLNMDTYEVLRRVEVAQEPVDAAISSRANFVDHAFVVSALDNTLSVIDLYSESAPIRQTVALGISSARVFAHPSKDEIVVVDLALGVEIYTLSSDTSKLIDLSRSYTFGLNDEEILDVVASDDGSRLFLLIKSNLDGELSVRTLNTETGVENSWSFILASDTGRYALKNTVTIFSKNRLGLSAYLPNSSKSLLLEPATDRLTLANIVFESQTNYGARNFSDDGQQALSVDYSNLELVIETKDEDDTVIKL
ncbi:MAG: hypothetical protein OEX00_07165, partial [Gammaproteobacteria bacterium]|nr:hypothetical protein [Gammaproteobacteria bacterium]